MTDAEKGIELRIQKNTPTTMLRVIEHTIASILLGTFIVSGRLFLTASVVRDTRILISNNRERNTSFVIVITSLKKIIFTQSFVIQFIYIPIITVYIVIGYSMFRAVIFVLIIIPHHIFIVCLSVSVTTSA